MNWFLRLAGKSLRTMAYMFVWFDAPTASVIAEQLLREEHDHRHRRELKELEKLYAMPPANIDR